MGTGDYTKKFREIPDLRYSPIWQRPQGERIQYIKIVFYAVRVFLGRFDPREHFYKIGNFSELQFGGNTRHHRRKPDESVPRVVDSVAISSHSSGSCREA
jgi:hypothetical protein